MDMPEIIPHKYLPVAEIRTNQRFATFAGELEGKKVFIKYAVDGELRERVRAEADGLDEMRRLDPSEAIFHVPGVVECTDNYIVTEWAYGVPMAEDFKEQHLAKVEHDIAYLVHIYAFIDQTAARGVGAETLSEQVDNKHIPALRALEYKNHVDSRLVDGVVAFIKSNAELTETRATNGDLQPGNLMIGEDSLPTVIDCESFGTHWPRHYNIVNFIFNYGAEYPGLRARLAGMMGDYGLAVNVNPHEESASFNVSAAIRSLQIIEERLSGDGLTPEVKAYVEAAMQNIVAGRLFNTHT